MYQLHSIWMVEQMTARPHDPHRPDRAHLRAPQTRESRHHAQPRRPGVVSRLRTHLASLAHRGMLGPVPGHCSGDPAGPRW